MSHDQAEKGTVEPKPAAAPDGEHPFEEGEEAPPPGVRVMAIVRWVLLIAVILAAAFSVWSYAVSYAGPLSATPPPSSQPAPAQPSPAATAPASPAGTTPITLTLDRIQKIGVRTALAERLTTSEKLRLSAIVEAPEQRRVEVHARAAGFVEGIRVRDTGVKVKAGETLATIYSPEIFQAQQELLAMSAWQGPDGVGTFPPPTDAARKRLSLLGLGEKTIDTIIKGGKPVRATAVIAPISGYALQKNVVLGSRVTPDMTLFEIADLSRVYIIASAYPSQLGDVDVGDAATFTTPSLPGRIFKTKVDLLYPEIDLATRTSRVRLQIDNQDLTLRPGQFGVIELSGRPTIAVTVPLDAVVDTGRSAYVFLAEEGGRFVPRSVELGEQLDDRFVIRSGMDAGERVVSGAAFLIDAESRLQASLASVSPEQVP